MTKLLIIVTLFSPFAFSQTANIWINSTAGTCTRSASLVAYNPVTACGTIEASFAVAANGDTVIVKAGSAGTYAGSHTLNHTFSSPGVLVKCENVNWVVPKVTPGAQKDSCAFGSGNGSFETDGAWYTLQDISYLPGNSGGTPTYSDPVWTTRCSNCTFTNFDVDGAFVGIFILPVQGSPGGDTTNFKWNGGELDGMTGQRSKTCSNGDNQPIWMGAMSDATNFFGNGHIVNAIIENVIMGPSFVNSSITCSGDPLHLDRNRYDGNIDSLLIQQNFFEDGGNENTGTIFISNFLGNVPNVTFRNNYIGGGGTSVLQNNTGGSCPWTFDYNTFTGQPTYTGCSAGMTYVGNAISGLTVCDGTNTKNVYTGGLTSCGTNFKATSLGLSAFSASVSTLVPSVGSSVVDRGETTCATTASGVDIFGNPRPSGAACDAGAMEFGSAPAQAATPTFSPVAGTYTGARSVTISTTSAGAIICYNTTGSPVSNGSTGCTTGTLYSGSVAVSASQTLFAVAGGTGFTDSPIASAAYVINPSLKMSGVTTMSGSAVMQ